METACYLVNRSPLSTLEDRSPHEVWTGKKPYLSHPMIFGCDAYVHVPKEKITKLDSKSKRCIFIGYKDGLKCYNILQDILSCDIPITNIIAVPQENCVVKEDYSLGTPIVTAKDLPYYIKNKMLLFI